MNARSDRIAGYTIHLSSEIVLVFDLLFSFVCFSFFHSPGYSIGLREI